MSTKRYQGGAVISFIIVAVIITAMLVGGLVWLRHRGGTERAAQVATQTDGSKAPAGVTKEKHDTQGDKKSTGDFSAGSSSVSQKEGTMPGNAKSQSVPDDLPQTGPTESIIAIVILSLVVYTAARYAMSRRELAQAFIA